MSKPNIICHMGSTVEGKIIGEHWGENSEKYGELYEKCHESFKSQAWMVGRITMEKDFTEGLQPEPVKPKNPVPATHFVGDPEASSFAISLDPSGKLGWQSNEIEGDHVIEILSEKAGDDYLQYLRDRKVSYIFAGKDNIDFSSALGQLYSIFGIKRLMLEGGGHINGSMLNAGLIDEISILILPIADGTSKSTTTFEVSDYLTRKEAAMLKLIEVKKLDYDVVWLRYEVKRKQQKN